MDKQNNLQLTEPETTEFSLGSNTTELKLNFNPDNNIQGDKELINMDSLALSNPTKYLATYENPKDWILDEQEAQAARVLRGGAEPEQASEIGTLAYSAGELIRKTGNIGRNFIGYLQGIDAYFLPNADEETAKRAYADFQKLAVQEEQNRAEYVSGRGVDPDVYGIGTNVMEVARDVLLTGGLSALSRTATKRAAYSSASRFATKEVAERFARQKASQAASKTAGRFIVGTTFVREAGDRATEQAAKYMEITGDYDLKYYDPTVDLALNTGVSALNSVIEASLGIERIIPNLLFGRGLTGTVAEEALKSFLGEGAEEVLQGISSRTADIIAGYEKNIDWEEVFKEGLVGGIIGGVFGSATAGGMYYLNRRRMIRQLQDIGVSPQRAAQITDNMLRNGIDNTLTNLSGAVELRTNQGKAWEQLVGGVETAMSTVGFGTEQSRREQAQTWARTNYAIAIKQAFDSGLNIDEFLNVAEYAVMNNGDNLNMIFVKPLGTVADIDRRIAEQNAVITRERELKKTGAGDNKVLQEARMRKNILQKAKAIKEFQNRRLQEQIAAQTTPELKTEIDTAKKDAESLGDIESFNEKNPEATTSEKVKRYGNAVIKKLFGKDTKGFNAVMVLPEATNAKNAIISVADRINNFIKAHRTYKLKTDLVNALNKLQTVTRENFIDSISYPALDGVDVIAENAFLYHFLFSDETTISKFLDSYITRAEQSLSGETNVPLSKKDLVGQAFKATDNMMQTQAQLTNTEYQSIYDTTGNIVDKNVLAVMLSYQNQFVEDTESWAGKTPSEVANEGLGKIYTVYTSEIKPYMKDGVITDKSAEENQDDLREVGKTLFSQELLDYMFLKYDFDPRVQAWVKENPDLMHNNDEQKDAWENYSESDLVDILGEYMNFPPENLVRFDETTKHDEDGMAIYDYDDSVYKMPSTQEEFEAKIAEAMIKQTKNALEIEDSDIDAYEVRKNETPYLFQSETAYTGDTIVVDGKERTVYNSNGDRIADTEEALTNFWRWFGDSKVVDEQGRPLVVYHGTLERFNEFDTKRFNTGAGNLYGAGFYFSNNFESAEDYGANVVSVYLKVNNPFVVEKGDTISKSLSRKGISKQEIIDKYGYAVEYGEEYPNSPSDIGYQKQIVSMGYDGIIVQHEFDKEFVAFEPNQIKSVDNRGTYSADTGNIYYQGKKANGFYDPEIGVIVLGRNMNEMTLPHEMQHYWLDTIFGIYKRAKSGELKVKDGWMESTKDLLNMLGVDENQTQLTRPQQEKFARMSEAYLTGIGISGDQNQTFREYLSWIPEKYKSILQLGYINDKGMAEYPVLDDAAVEFFNKWYANPSLPTLPTSPERQRFINPTDDKGEVSKVSIKEMNNREKEFGQDAEEQAKTDQRFYNVLDENMPSDIKSEADGQKVVQASRSNFLKESENQQRRWYERKSRDAEAQKAQEYIKNNPDHAKEIVYGDPELIPNDSGVDRATLINAYIATQDIKVGSDDWAKLQTNIAINQSLAGTQLALSNDKSYRTYLDALREVEQARELKAATNYAGAKEGALEKFNADIKAFVERELPRILGTTPDSQERELAIKSMFERARTTFSGNTTSSVLNQEDFNFAKRQKGMSQAFVTWAVNQIKKDAGAKLKPAEQAKLLEISAKAQQAQIDLDNPDAGKAVAAAQEIRKWQLEKQKLMGVSPEKFSLMGDYAPRAMLASFNTLVVANIPSTAINTGLTNLIRRGVFGADNVSDNLKTNEIRRIKAIYNATSMNLAQMEKPTSPSLLHGEKYSASGQKWYDPFTILGREDNWFRVPTFVNTLARIASTDAKKSGRNADEVFKEYCKLSNQTDEAKLARKQALAVANMAVFTQDGVVSRTLNHIRSEINKLTRGLVGLPEEGFGVGNLIAPFLKTGANIAEMGIRGALAPVTTITALIKSWRTGTAINPMTKLALGMDWAYFMLSAGSMVLLAALTSDDDDFYTEPYEPGKKYDPNKPYDSINIGGVWIDLDLFGPFAIPMRVACKFIQNWEKDKGIIDSLGQAYGKGAKFAAMDTPLVESLFSNQISYAVRKPEDYALGWGYNQLNKLVPAQLKPISRAVSRGQGWTLDTDFAGKVLSRKFNRNYGFDGLELTTQDWVDIFSTRFTVE